ncbi:hypothetical protein ACFY2W_05335 [Streptomyces sp. NPDC001262]|uniref:hypothetical protein n=1 Tax=Streptomyces sp. NPDC001262 TaxID=3364552 RepID=UPI0036B5E51B
MSMPDRSRPPRPTIASLTRYTTRLQGQLAELRHEHAELLAAARTALTAVWDGETEALSALVDALDRLDALPEYAPQLTAQALEALGPAGTPLVGRRIA